MDGDGDARITVAKNGPYVVEGDLPLTREAIETNQFGESWSWRLIEELEAKAPYRLCRCGTSGTQPFCDDSCATNGFDGTERPNPPSYDEMATTYPGPVLDLTDAPRLCAMAKFCDAQGSVWTQIERSDERSVRLARHAVSRCPSGRLVLWPHDERSEADGSNGERAPLERHRDPSIALVQDSRPGISGPIWVRGGIPISSADGEQYEIRNRVTLCRCGSSRNKPFCDGSHVRTRFSDGLGLQPRTAADSDVSRDRGD
jgi:CDGSH-type Zn-finger protein